MSIFYDYFLATTDDEARATLDWEAGPTTPPSPAATLDTLPLPGIEPVVILGTLEELLTGRSFDDLEQSEIVGSRDDDTELVQRLSRAFQEAIGGAPLEKLQQVVPRWSEAEEFWGQGDPNALLPMARDLCLLARTGLESGRGLYCWDLRVAPRTSCRRRSASPSASINHNPEDIEDKIWR